MKQEKATFQPPGSSVCEAPSPSLYTGARTDPVPLKSAPHRTARKRFGDRIREEWDGLVPPEEAGEETW